MLQHESAHVWQTLYNQASEARQKDTDTAMAHDSSIAVEIPANDWLAPRKPEILK